ncbi:putative membrane-anchored protein [Paraburkholderia sp. BL10I2N1]|nr:putative membrane-anchored protein [Paraburkholderia sp. BL10I2N1]
MKFALAQPGKRLLVAAVVALLVTTAQAADAVGKDPHYGPYSQEIASIGTWKVNQGYLSLDPADTTRLMEEMQNPNVQNSWLYAPEGLKRWFAVIRYVDTGHVNDDEKIDPVAILEQLKKGTELSNEERRKRGWPEMHLIGWQVEPHYESDTQRLSWATLSESDGQKIVNYTTKVLSRTGVATVILVTDPASLDQSVAELKTQLDGFAFNPDQTYAEFRGGDKIAEYGLTGLIVGGAAAAAVKTGAWKWVVGILAAGWKFVAAAVVALLAGVKSLVKRRRSA